MQLLRLLLLTPPWQSYLLPHTKQTVVLFPFALGFFQITKFTGK